MQMQSPWPNLILYFTMLFQGVRSMTGYEHCDKKPTEKGGFLANRDVDFRMSGS
jgi:hypothetical protein